MHTVTKYLASLILSTCALVPGYAGVSVNLDQAMIIEGPITNGNINPLGDLLLVAVEQKFDYVDLIINSPGGSVTTGFMFISKMEAAKASGLKIRCFVSDVAASMAFGILVHCSERYALSNSFLLWHRARIFLGGMGGTVITGPQAMILGRDLISVDNLILQEVLDAMSDADEKKVKYHFENETLHVGTNLQKISPDFITVLPTIPGLYEAIRDKEVPRSARTNPFDLLFGDSEIVYIHEKLLDK